MRRRKRPYMEMFDKISHKVGNMSERKWTTKFKDAPARNSIKSMNNVCRSLIQEVMVDGNDQSSNPLWVINCTVYAVVITWALSNSIACEQKESRQKGDKQKPKWLQNLDEKIASTRKLISRCEAERARLCRNGRMT